MLKSLVREAVGAQRPAPAPVAVVTPDQTAPAPRAAAHLAAARQALLQGRVEEGAEAAQAALAEDDDDLFAAFCLGTARLRQERYAEARAAFEQAGRGGDPFGLVGGWLARLDTLEREAAPRLDRETSQAIELERAARAALRVGDPGRARELASQAIALDADNLVAHHLLGRALQALGEHDAARAAFATARAHDIGLGVVSEWLAGDAPAWPALDAVPVDDEPDDADWED